MKPVSGYRTLSQLVILSRRPSAITDSAPSGSRSTSSNSASGESGSVVRRRRSRRPSSTHDVQRGLVLAQPLERGRAHHPLGGPLAELDLGHQRGLDEHRLARKLGRGRRTGSSSRRSGSRRRLSSSSSLLGEAGPDPPGVAQRAVVVHAHQQRPDPRRCAGPRPAASPPITSSWRQRVLDLQPRAAAPAGLVARVQPLGDDPLEPLLLGRLEQPRAGAADAAAGTRHAGPAELERLERGAALASRDGPSASDRRGTAGRRSRTRRACSSAAAGPRSARSRASAAASARSWAWWAGSDHRTRRSRRRAPPRASRGRRRARGPRGRRR